MTGNSAFTVNRRVIFFFFALFPETLNFFGRGRTTRARRFWRLNGFDVLTKLYAAIQWEITNRIKPRFERWKRLGCLRYADYLSAALKTDNARLWTESTIGPTWFSTVHACTRVARLWTFGRVSGERFSKTPTFEFETKNIDFSNDFPSSAYNDRKWRRDCCIRLTPFAGTVRPALTNPISFTRTRVTSIIFKTQLKLICVQ